MQQKLLLTAFDKQNKLAKIRLPSSTMFTLKFFALQKL